MSEVTFKCPSCGAYLVFDPEKQQLVCPFCGKSFRRDELTAESAKREAEAKKADSHVREYHCATCGAELVTDDTTAATFCYYCHNPIVLADRLSDDFHPDAVIPFKLDREHASSAFTDYIHKKHFVRREFFGQENLEKMTGVYYPYWVGDMEGNAVYDGEGTRSTIRMTPREEIITTWYYRVHREGKLSFRNMVRKALKKNDRTLSDGIFPYALEAEKPFAMGYLSGFMAEKRDIDKQEAEADMLQEADGYVESAMTQNVGLETLHGNADAKLAATRMRYVLLPTWVLTYRGDKPGKTYFYMMNGQKGTVCGRLPINWPKLLLWGTALGAAVAGLFCAGGAWLW